MEMTKENLLKVKQSNPQTVFDTAKAIFVRECMKMDTLEEVESVAKDAHDAALVFVFTMLNHTL